MKDFLGKKLEKIRIKNVLPHIEGRLLDVGSGMNNLVRQYGNGLGVDVYPWEGSNVVVENTAYMPFSNKEFDTVSIIAALNHIPNRSEVILECCRVLKPKGKLIITMLPPRISRVWHLIRSPWDADQKERGMKEGEVYGMTGAQIISLVERKGFKLETSRKFMLGINNLYIFRKV